MGHDGLPADLDGHDPDLWQALGHVWAQANPDICALGLLDRLTALWHIADDGAAHHLPRVPGHRRRWSDVHGDRDRRRPLYSTRARQVAGCQRRRLRRRVHPRSDHRWLDHRSLVVALGVLRQPAAGYRRTLCAGLPDADAAPAEWEGAYRLYRRHVADRRHGSAAAWLQ